jgi:hypothetical protein
MDPKQLKKVKQEASQKASQINKSGLPFFCTLMEEPQGDIKALLEAMETINTVIKKPNGEIVRDVSQVGKLLISVNDDQMSIVTYVPNGLYENFTAKSWTDSILDLYNLKTVSCSDCTNYDKDDNAFLIIPNQPDKNIYVFKLRDEIISKEYAKLRSNGLIPPLKEDDDETLLGDDAFDLES